MGRRIPMNAKSSLKKFIMYHLKDLSLFHDLHVPITPCFALPNFDDPMGLPAMLA